MTDEKQHQRLRNLHRALYRLGEALAVPYENELTIDGTIRRFEFTFELCWKALKGALEAEGLQASTPREALRQAYAAGWIADEPVWLGMLHDRNQTSHLYDEALAGAIYTRIRTYYPVLEAASQMLNERAANDAG